MRVVQDDLAALHRNLAEAMVQSLRTSIATSDFIAGASVDHFEQSWAEYCGASHAVGVASGTSALHLALTALNIGPHDEVIVPANTFFATVEAIVRAGARPVYCDVDPKTMLIDIEDAESRITPRTRAMILVHLYGNVCDLDRANEAALRHGLVLIEDAAQAHGARWRGRRPGSLGSIACYSFYPGKNLGALGDAGAVVLNDSSLAETIRSLANHGQAPGHPGQHLRVGGTDRMDSLQAQFLDLKLPQLDDWNRRRRAIAGHYRANLPEGRIELTSEPEGGQSACHQFVVRVDDRTRLAADLCARGVVTRIHYPTPCHRQPASIALLGECRLPVVEAITPRILSLPCSPSLSDADVEWVVESMRQCC